MDPSSSYTQTPQPDPNQYHHQSQPQPQLPYDPSTIQPHDPNTYYYPSFDPNQPYQYYQDYTTNSQFYQQPTSIHPPGVPIPAPISETAHLQNAYYGHGAVENNQLQPADSGSGSGQAAGSEVTQLPVQVEVAQVKTGQTLYRGGGRRGNRPFRGGGRGHLGYHGHGPDGSAPPFHGRGRGQGGGRHFQLYGTALSNPNSASVPAEGVASFKQQPSALVSLQAPLPVPTQVSSASFWRPPRMAWCELCRVDCNTLETLEQHKNGKRHKKILQVHEELQKANKVNTEKQIVQIPNTELKSVVGQTEKVEGSEEKQPSEGNLTSEVVTDDNRNETDRRKMVGNSEASEEPENKSNDQFAARGRGSKRRMRGGRGGKYLRTHEGSRRVVEPPKPKVNLLICELCSVKCESQVVFDSHVSGKKHLAALKRFQVHRAMYGEQGLQALYPPNLTAASTSVAPPVEQVPLPHIQQVPSPHVQQVPPHVQQVNPPHVQQGIIDPHAFLAQVQQGGNDPEVLLGKLLVSYMLSKTQAQGGSTSSVATAPGTNIETQNQLQSHIQGLLAICQNGIQSAIVGAQNQQQSGFVNSGAPAAGNTDTNTRNQTLQIHAKEASCRINDSVVVSAESAGPSKQVSEEASNKECNVVASAPVQQQPVNQMQEPESKKE
ncbi:uncharacterized protein LOC126803348 [Argentina anserina]|uniref:uncharacterized protein LOC126803348 n=1 Tax=Argentina anserina TaxID=57926 RepID=UPI0021767B9D|nr:uncharacterized protein LOC126803348 [Potentilla anserina]